jgi:hypothetical protein
MPWGGGRESSSSEKKDSLSPPRCKLSRCCWGPPLRLKSVRLPTLGSTCYLAHALACVHEVEDRERGQRTNQCRCCHCKFIVVSTWETRLRALPSGLAEEEKMEEREKMNENERNSKKILFFFFSFIFIFFPFRHLRRWIVLSPFLSLFVLFWYRPSPFATGWVFIFVRLRTLITFHFTFYLFLWYPGGPFRILFPWITHLQ